MDGRSSATLFDSTSVVRPLALALDYEGHTLYWIDALKNTISKSEADGFNHQIILELNRTFLQETWDVFGLDYFNGFLYFGDWHSDSVFALNVNRPNSSLRRLTQLDQHPGSIRVVNLQRQQARES